MWQKSNREQKGEGRMKEELSAEMEKESSNIKTEEDIPPILEEIAIEDLTVDGICGVY